MDVMTVDSAERKPGSRERIIEAALDEFAAKGVAGARVNDIARNAGVNIRMIYHHFESKQGLFQEVTREVFRQRQRFGASRDQGQGVGFTPEEFLLGFFDDYTVDDRWVRLLEWESLEASQASQAGEQLELTDAEQRIAAVDRRVALLARFQEEGLIAPTIDLRMLYVAMVSLTMVAVAFPPTVQFATGMSPGSDEFREKYREFLRTIAPGLFRPPAD